MKMEKKREEAGGPWVLSIIRHGPTQYFTDLRLPQFRNVGNPHDYVDFDSDKGRECQMAAIVSRAIDKKELRCMNCLALIVPRVEL
jgi:hypothetical protein